MECPICHSDDQVRSARTIYESGTQRGTTQASSAALGYVGGDIVPFIGETWGNTQSQTVLAQRLSPPGEPQLLSVSYLVLGLALTGFSLFFVTPGLMYLGTIGVVIGGLLVYRFGEALIMRGTRQEAYRQALRSWRSLYYCYRCDHIFR